MNDLNDQELSKIDARTDGEVEVIDVKLNNRKTKKIGDSKEPSNNAKKSEIKLSRKIKKKIKIMFCLKI